MCNIFKIFSFKKNLKRVFWYSIFSNNNNKSTKIAIKMEKIEKNSSEIETRRLLYLQRDGIPKIYCYGNNQTHNILIQELLGCSLEDIFNSCNKKQYFLI